MIKRIVKHGCGHALTLDKTLLGLTGIDPEGYVDVVVDGNRMIVVPRKGPLPKETVKRLRAFKKTHRPVKAGSLREHVIQRLTEEESKP